MSWALPYRVHIHEEFEFLFSFGIWAMEDKRMHHSNDDYLMSRLLSFLAAGNVREVLAQM